MKMMVFALLMSVGAVAHADGEIFGAPFSTMSIPVSSFSTTYCAGNPQCNSKIIIERAKPDAATFVATDGGIRGANLEQAISHIHETMPQNTDSDMILAQKIVAEQF